MSRWARRRLIMAIAAMTAMAACSSPNPTLYTLAAVPGTSRPGTTRIIVLREASVARYLERPQIVRSSESYQLDIAGNDWWGEPLPSMLGRVLVEALAQRLPGSVVLSDAGAVGISPDAVVELNILRLDEDGSGTVVLRAQISVSRTAARLAPSVRSVEIRATPPSPDTRGEVAGMSDALGQLADRIAEMLRVGS